MKVLLLALICCVAHGAFILRKLPDIAAKVEAGGVIELDLADSLGYVCADGENEDAVAAVVCGGTGKGHSVPAADVKKAEAEFAIDVHCVGHEASLNDCDPEPKAVHKCAQFVAATCQERRALRGVL